MTLCTQDMSFGPGSTCRPLDFTLYFEQTILSFSPDVIFFVVACGRLVFLSRQSVKLANPSGRGLVAAKALAIGATLASSITSAVYAARANSKGVVPIWLPVPVLQVITVASLGAVILLQHFKSIAPNTIVITYALFKGLFTSATVRTYSQLGVGSTSSELYISTACVAAAYFTLMGLELVEKRRLLLEKSLPTVSTASFISRSLYFWLMPLLWHGRKKVLTVDDCGTIPNGLTAKSTRNKLQQGLAATPQTESYLFKSLLKAFPAQFMGPIVPRIILLLATFAQPLLVNKTIEFVANPDRPDSHGWALVGGFVCIYTLISLSTSLYWEKVFNSMVRFRGALVGGLFEKTLVLSSASCGTLGGGVASTYMSVDVERICEGVEMMHEMWASIFGIVIAVALIYQQATWPAFLPIVVTVVVLGISASMGKSVNVSQNKWLTSTDKRVKFLSSVINNFLPIKWSKYESAMEKRASELRREEMVHAKKFYAMSSIVAAMSNTAATICVLSVLGPYAALASRDSVEPLDAQRLFTIVTTVNLLSDPLNMLAQSLPSLAAAYASLKRIQSFLLLDERGEHPLLLEKSSDLAASPIEMTKASFAWGPGAEPFLKDMSIDLTEDKLYMCVGSVASGKTLLLLSILGEAYLRAGEYSAPSHRIAYSSQDALIIPGTVRENILFGRPYSPEFYHKVLEACALTSDLRNFRSGDGTFLEDARRLSGGQSQRIALARAVYADAPWTLLDDSFSALDAETSAHITQALFGPGGLLKGKAVVLVTHDIKPLTLADHIIVMESGTVKAQGTLAQVQAEGHTLVDRALALDSSSEEKAKKIPTEIATEHTSETVDGEEVIGAASRGWTPYIFFIRMAGLPATLRIAVFIFIAAGMRIAVQVYLREWAKNSDGGFGAWAGGYAGMSFGLALANLVAPYYFTSVITSHTGKAMHKAELEGLFQAPPAFIMTTSAGKVINRFSQDIFKADFEVPLAFLNFFMSSLLVIGTAVLIFFPVPWLTLSILPLGLFYYTCIKFYAGTAKQLQGLDAASKSPLYTLFGTTVSGLQTIRALHVQPYFQGQNDHFLNRSQKPFFFRFGSMRFLRTALSIISFFVAVGLSVSAVALRGRMDTAALGLALSSLTGLTGMLTRLLMSLADVENGSVAISRIHEIAYLSKEEEVIKGPQPDSQWPSTGHMLFKKVQFRYKPDLAPALKGVTFSFSGGQRIGICGRSGSGKSSLILALYRALDQSLVDGQIFIDGLDTATIPLAALRESISLVAQHPFLWHSTIRDNLDPEGRSTEDELWAALKQVGLGEAISELPERLDTVLEDGGSLSKGQRQLMCLSRVLLRKRKIVVLDEASSSLDSHTDDLIRQVIQDELKGCTVLAVAHRISTIIDFDKIIVMEDGHIVETGSPAELMSRADSKFYRLASSQGIFVV